MHADKDLETMFTKELKRRGLDSIDDVGGWTPADEGKQACSMLTGQDWQVAY
jgi:hypothetical protein